MLEIKEDFVSLKVLQRLVTLVKKYGLPQAFSCEEFGAAIGKIAGACAKSGSIFGIWNSDVAGKGPMGARFMVVDGDIHSMQATLSKSLEEKKAKTGFAALSKSDRPRLSSASGAAETESGGRGRYWHADFGCGGWQGGAGGR